MNFLLQPGDTDGPPNYREEMSTSIWIWEECWFLTQQACPSEGGVGPLWKKNGVHIGTVTGVAGPWCGIGHKCRNQIRTAMPWMPAGICGGNPKHFGPAMGETTGSLVGFSGGNTVIDVNPSGVNAHNCGPFRGSTHATVDPLGINPHNCRPLKVQPA